MFHLLDHATDLRNIRKHEQSCSTRLYSVWSYVHHLQKSFEDLFWTGHHQFHSRVCECVRELKARRLQIALKLINCPDAVLWISFRLAVVRTAGRCFYATVISSWCSTTYSYIWRNHSFTTSGSLSKVCTEVRSLLYFCRTGQGRRSY